jgi:hypothetical protein
MTKIERQNQKESQEDTLEFERLKREEPKKIDFEAYLKKRGKTKLGKD